MQLDWTTFVLEIVNFLVLVWLLKRFLYKPVLDIIAQRKAAIDKSLADAESQKKDAQQLEEKYQNRLSVWEQEKEGLRRDLAAEMQTERGHRMEELQQSLAAEREKQNVLTQRRAEQTEQEAAKRGLQQGLKFTARLLDRLAGPELEQQLIHVMAADLAQLPAEQQEKLRTACRDSQPIKVTSAFPLPDDRRAEIHDALAKLVQQEVALNFREDSNLRAGIRVQAGAWMLRANLQDELAWFEEHLHEGA